MVAPSPFKKDATLARSVQSGPIMLLSNHTMPWAGGARSLREGAPEAITGCKKNQRKFWSYLLYSRIVSWGREFKTVRQYIQKNTLEALHLIAYQKRTKKGKNKYANSS